MIVGIDEEDKFDIKQSNIIEFKDRVEEVKNTFCYGSVLHTIPITYYDDGDVTEIANLLSEPHLCPIEKVR